MNEKLRMVLATLPQLTDLETTLQWHDVLLVQNTGRIPPSRPAKGDLRWNRGFNLMLLDRDGSPAFFCKCRPASDNTLAQATAICERLTSNPDLCPIVPWTRGLRSEDFQIQVSRMVKGKGYDRIAPTLSVVAWAKSVREILSATDLVCSRAAALMPELLNRETSVELSKIAAPYLTHLRSAGMSSKWVRALEATVDVANPARPRIQHGDLWPSNIIRGRRGWCLLDFEMFAEIQVPLYDVYHLLRSSTAWDRTDRRGQARRSWIDWMADIGARPAATRDLIAMAAQRQGLDSAQAMGALVYYLADIATRLQRRGTPRAFWEPLFTDLERLAALILQGRIPLASIFWNS